MKQFIAALFIAGLTIPVAAQTSGGSDPVVIRFEGGEVRQSELDAAIESLPPEYQAMAQGPAKKRFAEEYVRMRILAHEAQKNKLDQDPAVRRQLKLAHDNTLASAQLERLQDSLAVSEADVNKAYEAGKASYEQVRARHILIAPQGSPAAPAGGTQLTDEQARAKAEELRAKIAAGADFAELAKAESHDTVSGARGGELGEFPRGTMVPAFENAAFSQEVGKVGPVVKTQYGYHVILVDERGTTPLAELRPEIEQQLRQDAMRKRIEDLVGAAEVRYDETFFPDPAAAPAPAPQAPGSR